MEIHCGVFLLIFSQSYGHSPITHMGQESGILLHKFVFPPLARVLVFFLPFAHRITQHFRSCSEQPDSEMFVPLWCPCFDRLRMFSAFYPPSSIPSQEQAKGSSPEAWLSVKSLRLDLEGTVIKIRYKVCFGKDLHDLISV